MNNANKPMKAVVVDLQMPFEAPSFGGFGVSHE